MRDGNALIKDSLNIENHDKTNYNSFDLAKFICSILVVMIHISPFGVQKNANVFSYINFLLQQGLCRIAVPLFFVFNGFLLYNKKPLNEFSISSATKYCKHILYMYIIWSVIYFPISLFDIVSHPQGVLQGFLVYIKKFILIGSYTHLWYLLALVFAVLLISVLLCAKLAPKKILCISLFFYVFGLLGDGYFRIISPLFDVPFVGEIISIYFKVFGETKNGLFFAFFFVSLGMILSTVKNELSSKKSLFLFLISLFMMCIESTLLKTFNLARDYNILLFAIPSALFCFLFLKSLNLKDGKIYKSLRELSSLIYYGHLFVYGVVSRCLLLFGSEFRDTPIRFVSTLILTILIALTVTNISCKEKFRWLKKLY